MPVVEVDTLSLEFPDEWTVAKYDAWAFYRNQFARMSEGVKAVDLVALGPGVVCWLIEVKDYRIHPRTKTLELAEEVARKVRDTLAGLVAARVRASVPEELEHARMALAGKGLRVALHVEQPAPGKASKLFPRPVNPANVLQSLKQRLKAIDPHPIVVDGCSSQGVPWTARSRASGGS